MTYDPTLDLREQVVLDNCVAAGVDPTTLGIIVANATSSPFVSVEVLQFVGTTDLAEEKSESWTAGFAWEQPFFESFDLSIGATYYEIAIRDEIVQFSFQGAINDCYEFADEGVSPFCSAVRREDLGGGAFGLIEEVDQNFINRDALKTRGVDVNMTIDWPTSIFGKAVDLSADFNFNRKLEFSDLFILDDGSRSADSDLGDFGLPEWEGQSIFRASFSDYRLSWAMRYLSSVEIDPDVRADYPYSGADWLGGDSYTCLGADAGDVDCRPVGEAENYFRHDVSLYYYGDVWTLGVGARNVFDEEPPLVDPRPISFDRSNVPLGRGYDVQGRQFFFNVSAAFDTPSF